MKTRLNRKRPPGIRLFLRLPLTVDGAVAWWFGDPLAPQHAQSGQLAGLSDLETLPEAARRAPAVLWLPAEQCVLEPVTFSGRARLRPEQLAQLLGDSLSEDISDWLWWRLPTKEKQPLLLGCPKPWLAESLAALYEANVQVVQILPELSALPDEPALLTRAGGRWLYREGGGRGAWLHADWIAEILPQWRDCETIALYGPAPFSEARWAAEYPHGGEALLAEHSAGSGVNLLSRLPAGLRPRSGKRYWPRATGLLAAAMVLALAGTLSAALLQYQQAASDRQQMAALWQGWFPQDKRGDIDVYERLRRQRRSLTQQFGSINFFNAFWQYARLQQAWRGPQLQHLLFDRDKRSMTVEVSLSAADARQAPAQARRAGAAVKLSPAGAERVNAAFTLRGANEN